MLYQNKNLLYPKTHILKKIMKGEKGNTQPFLVQKAWDLDACIRYRQSDLLAH